MLLKSVKAQREAKMWTVLKAIGCVLALVLSGEASAGGFGNTFGCIPTPPNSGGWCNESAGVLPPPTPLQALPTDLVALGRPVGNNFFTGLYLPLSSFASAADVTALQGQMAALQGQMIAFQKQAIEMSAVAASFTILPPNPGDRFSLNFGTAGGDGVAAGSVSGTYRLTGNTLIFGGYARGATQSMAKGGMSLSFR
jgi:hypothetical protein